MSDTTFDPNAVDYTGIEPGADQEYRKIKSCTTVLEYEEFVWEVDDKGRQVIRVRSKIVDPSSVELVKEEGDEALDPSVLTPGGIFDRFYFHTPGAIGMFARWLERNGLSWEDYKATTDKKAYVESLMGLKYNAVIVYDTEYRNNKLKKYLGVAN